MHGGSKIDQSFIDKYSNRENADQTADFSTASVKLGRADDVRCTTALPPKADVHLRSCYVAFVPIADIYSITSSARASTEGGTVSPIALAVLRLITVSYLVGVCTGRSAGFSPLRMRST
jgi:hypothetical protein